VTDDDLRKLAEAIRQGRKIFSNLKKAIRYIISIHIPILLTASLPLLLSWKYPNIFTPVHVIFLELIMGPTCSIFYEREPIEDLIMMLSPRKREARLFETDEFLISTVQGLVIAGSVLVLYYWFMAQGDSLFKVRTIVFTTLILSNTFLTFVNRSFTETLFKTLRYKNNLALPVVILSVCFLLIIHLSPLIRNIFGMTVISFAEFGVCILAALVGVIWFEFYKAHLNREVAFPRTDYGHAF
jgi:Ca2+-transporting ATPase